MINQPKILPSRKDSVCAIISDIESSLEVEELRNKLDNLESNTKEEIKIRREYRSKQEIGSLPESTIYNQIHTIYEVDKKFRAGVFHEEFRTDLYVDRVLNNGVEKEILIGSGLYYKEEDSIYITHKEDCPSIDIKEIKVEVPGLYVHILNLCISNGLEEIQKYVDLAKAKLADGQVAARGYYDFLIKRDIERSLSKWSQTREVSRREIIHSAFRSRLDNEVENYPRIKKEEIHSREYYYIDEDSEYLFKPPNTLSGATDEEIGAFQSLVSSLKIFDPEKTGLSRERLQQQQDIIENQPSEETNAPQIYRTVTIKNNILPHLFRDKKLKLSKNDIYLILQKDVENYLNKPVIDIGPPEENMQAIEYEFEEDIDEIIQSFEELEQKERDALGVFVLTAEINDKYESLQESAEGREFKVVETTNVKNSFPIKSTSRQNTVFNNAEKFFKTIGYIENGETIEQKLSEGSKLFEKIAGDFSGDFTDILKDAYMKEIDIEEKQNE